MVERIPLSDMKNGETGTIAEVLGGRGMQNRLRSLRIMPGVRIQRISGTFSHGPVVLQIGNAQTALGFGVCYKVIAEVQR
jgi:ferrous iron transport protein A